MSDNWVVVVTVEIGPKPPTNGAKPPTNDALTAPDLAETDDSASRAGAALENVQGGVQGEVLLKDKVKVKVKDLNTTVEFGDLELNSVEERKAMVRSEAKECFEYWQQRCEHPKARLGRDRQAKIVARLNEGYTVEQIKQAIDGAAVGAFTNDSGHRFDDIELICRNGTKLESFIERAGAKPPQHPVHQFMGRFEDFYEQEGQS